MCFIPKEEKKEILFWHNFQICMQLTSSRAYKFICCSSEGTKSKVRILNSNVMHCWSDLDISALWSCVQKVPNQADGGRTQLNFKSASHLSAVFFKSVSLDVSFVLWQDSVWSILYLKTRLDLNPSVLATARLKEEIETCKKSKFIMNLCITLPWIPVFSLHISIVLRLDRSLVPYLFTFWVDSWCHDDHRQLFMGKEKPIKQESTKKIRFTHKSSGI